MAKDHEGKVINWQNRGARSEKMSKPENFRHIKVVRKRNVSVERCNGDEVVVRLSYIDSRNGWDATDLSSIAEFYSICIGEVSAWSVT